NGFGELTAYAALFSGSPVYSAQYTRDKLGRVVEKTETIGAATDTFDYVYDVAGRLMQVVKNGATISSYAYDSNGNRLSYTSPAGPLAGVYDGQDRLLQYGQVSYTYGATGELRSKTIAGQTTQLSNDALGNLKTVVLSNGDHIDYIIDGLNR